MRRLRHAVLALFKVIMDKKYISLGAILLALGFGLMFWQSQHYVAVEPSSVEVKPSQESPLMLETNSQVSASSKEVSFVQKKEEALAFTNAEAVEEQLYTLENEAIAVCFTTKGGAIKEISLKQYPLVIYSPEPFVFNAETDEPALALALSEEGLPQNFSPAYELLDQSPTLIRFKYTSPEGLEVIRAYQISTDANQKDPYSIQHETRFSNKAEEAFDLKRIFVNVGSFPETEGDTTGEYLNFGYYNGKKAEFVKISEFRDSKGFLGIGSRSALLHKVQQASVRWASVKNQFFASVLTPQSPALGIFVRPTELNTSNSTQEGITGSLLFSLGSLEKEESKCLSMNYYVGPKELRRLENLGDNQELIMQFGFFGVVSKFLLSVMLIVHKLIPNWGLTIIAVTVLIKLFLWPLTTAQVRSSKRMAALQGPLKAIKQQYANNPQKQQAETMKLFKEYKVNPAAGCLPLLVQLPIFLGLYFMLRTASELRFAPFLWVADLSVPDTVYRLAGFPINPLPLLMGVTMYYQMKLMPSPSTDDMQRKLLQFMPFMFLFFCYHFPAGLVLYWTVQNLLTILQQSFTSKTLAPEAGLAPKVSPPNPFKKS